MKTTLFQRLATKKLGRLVIYADVLTSSMHVTDCASLEHGLAVIARQQVKGQGKIFIFHCTCIRHYKEIYTL